MHEFCTSTKISAIQFDIRALLRVDSGALMCQHFQSLVLRYNAILAPLEKWL